MREIYEALREARIEIPCPQRDLHLRENGDSAIPQPQVESRAEEPSQSTDDD